jgi:hypothetical protein
VPPAGKSSFWKLKSRGLRGVTLAITDDHAGLKRSLAEVLPEARSGSWGAAASGLSMASGRLEGLVKMPGHSHLLRECKRRKITTETFLGGGRLFAPLPIR